MIDTAVAAKVNSMVVRLAFQFLWTGSAKNGVRTFEKWSDLRKEIKSMIRRGQDKVGGGSIQAAQMEPGSIGKHLMELVGNQNDDESQQSACGIISDFQEVSGDIKAFIVANPATVPMKFHCTVTKTVSHAGPKIQIVRPRLR